MKKKKEIVRTVKHKLVLNLEQESKLLEKSFLALREAFNLHERTFCSQFHHYTSFKGETGQKLKLHTLSDAEKHVLNHIFFSKLFGKVLLPLPK